MSIFRATSHAIAAVMVLAACSGERPTVTPQQGPSQAVSTDPGVNAVSDLLLNPPSEFTAKYSIQPTASDSEATQATVSSNGELQRVEIGDVEFFLGPSGDITCSAGRSTCASGLNDGPISNLMVTHEFWAASTNRRLLSDASRKIGTAKAYDETIASQPATCVDIPIAGPTENGNVTYCATTTGLLALYRGADSEIKLTEFGEAPGAADLAPPTTNSGS